MNNNTIPKITALLDQLRQSKPLVEHITNYVTVNDCANVTLAIGASPIMADDIREISDIVSISQAVVINIGTMNQTIESMIAAGKEANKRGIPVVLDPVGAGASELRNRTVNDILEQTKCSVIRGNMSEIRFIAGLSNSTKGVDASETDLEAGSRSGIETSKILAEKLGCVVAITGATDIISDGKYTFCIENGHKMMGSITGTGCMCTSLVASYCGAAFNAAKESGYGDYLTAATAGILCMGIAGELAYETAGQMGTGSFHIKLIDEISKLNAAMIHRRAKLHEANY